MTAFFLFTSFSSLVCRLKESRWRRGVREADNSERGKGGGQARGEDSAGLVTPPAVSPM